MRTGKELLIASAEFAHEQRWKSWWHLWSTLLLLAGAVTVACLNLPWVVCLGASLLATLLLVRMFIIYHDYQHGAILRNSPLATVVMSLYGLVMLSPPGIWKHAHNDHHKNNARKSGPTLGTFPVLSIEEYAAASRWERFCYLVARHPLTIAAGYITVFLWEMCLHSFFQDPKRHFDGAVAVLLHASIIVALCFVGPQALVLGFLLPVALGSALGSYLFYAQHNFPDAKIRHGAQWDYVHAALWSSSLMRMGPVMHWFTGNIGYHHVHHLNAKIPFYRLPEAMAGIEELQSPSYTSLRPWEIVRCLRLKLWDPARDRLVTFREAAQAACLTSAWAPAGGRRSRPGRSFPSPR